MRRIAMSLVVASLAACARATDQEPKQDSLWNTFWSAARDYAAGPPDAKALSGRRRFEQAGISFEYPAPLRATVGSDGDDWTLTYGDFDLELHAPQVEMSADDYVGTLAAVFDNGRAHVEKLDGLPVTWCGHDITPVHVRFTMFGDRHDMRGYDLPAPKGESRFLVFDDVLVDGMSSTVADAAFVIVAATLRCS